MKTNLWLSGLVVMVGVALSGCGNEKVATTPTAPTARATCLPDLVADFDDGNGEWFDKDNCFTAQIVDRLTQEPIVRAELDRFAEEGYRLAREHALVVRGTPSGSDRLQTITLLPLGRPGDDDSAIDLWCVDSETGTRVVPMRVTRAGGTAGEASASASGDIVFEAIEPLFGTFLPGAAARWNWRRFGGCVGGGLIRTGTTCVVMCRLSLVAYPDCVIACGGAGAVGSLLGCAFQEFFGGR